MSITLETLPQATAQEVFDQVALHLLTQMQESRLTCAVDDPSMTGACAYRGDNDLKCAAGALISDDEYREYMEGESWTGLVTAGVVPDDHRQLITDLQKTHDYYAPAQWHEELCIVAHKYNLAPPADRTCTP